MLNQLIKRGEKVPKDIIEGHFAKKGLSFNEGNALIIGLFNEIVQKAKSYKVLKENKIASSRDSIARSLFESYVYLQFVLKSNNKRDLAHSYLASVRNDEFALYRLITEDNRVGRKIRDWLNIDESSIKKDSGIDEDYFDQELFSNVYQMRKPNHKWYNLDGKTNNLEALCHRLEMDEYYNLIYRIFSKEVHSKNVMKLYQIEQEHLVGLGITVDEKLHDSIISFYLLNSIRDVYKEYGMKKELREFNAIVSINYRYKRK
ncbi:DUF5677 domain-containing protein [Oceanobacillus profundus]|uniref:DUF5677 domain-containing protein n=1 Tax=Oceanobacillus profundus TaxID=372463 RepID=UPI00362A8780